MVTDTKRYLLSEMTATNRQYVSSDQASGAFTNMKDMMGAQRIVIEAFIYGFNLRTRTPIPEEIQCEDYYVFIWFEPADRSLGVERTPNLLHLMFVIADGLISQKRHTQARYHFCLKLYDYLIPGSQYMGEQWDLAIEEHKMREYAIKNGYTHTFALKPDHEIRKVVEQVLTEKGLIK